MWKLWKGTSQGLFVHSVDFFCWCVLLWTLATQTWTPTLPHTWEEMGTMFHDDIKDRHNWFLRRHNKGLGYEDFIYVNAMKNFIAGVLTPVGGFMALKLGARPLMALGCLIMAWVIISEVIWTTPREVIAIFGRGIITYSISIFQERIPSPFKSEFHVI